MGKKTIVFDFDGVIHQGYTGYKDGSIYGKINYKLLDYIKELMKDYYIVISSNRSASQIVTFMNQLNTGIKFELFDKSENNMYWNKDDVIGVTNDKAIGILYIDDRAYRYINNSKNDIETQFNINQIQQQLTTGFIPNFTKTEIERIYSSLRHYDSFLYSKITECEQKNKSQTLIDNFKRERLDVMKLKERVLSFLDKNYGVVLQGN